MQGRKQLHHVLDDAPCLAGLLLELFNLVVYKFLLEMKKNILFEKL